VKEAFFHINPDDEHSRLAARGKFLEQRRVGRELRRAIDPQRLIGPRYAEEQADAWILQDVLVAIGQFVAGAIRDEQRLTVDDLDKPGRIALR